MQVWVELMWDTRRLKSLLTWLKLVPPKRGSQLTLRKGKWQVSSDEIKQLHVDDARCMLDSTVVHQEVKQFPCGSNISLSADTRLHRWIPVLSTHPRWSPCPSEGCRSASDLAPVSHLRRWRTPTPSRLLLPPSAGSRLNRQSRKNGSTFILFSLSAARRRERCLPLSCESPLKAPQPHFPVAMSGSSPWLLNPQ